VGDGEKGASVSAFFGAYGLSCSLSGRKIVDEVSFELERGSFTALLGPNGSGKTTLLKACAGMLENRSGSVRCMGRELADAAMGELARVIAYVAPELAAEFPLTAKDAVMLGRIAGGSGLLTLSQPRDGELVREAMELCHCWELRSRNLQSLSGGERQLVTLACALAREPKVLLLDETLSRMDLNHQAALGARLRELARERGLAIVLVAHDVNLATEWADHCLLLQQGRILAAGRIESTWTTENARLLYPDSGLVVERSRISGRPKVHFAGQPLPTSGS
jgi:iron complex transport system ATP-binding protein